MDKPAFQWREKILSVGGALIIVALPILLLPRPEYAWIVAVVGVSLLLAALLAIILDRKVVSVKARLLAPWRRLKLLRFRSPLFIEPFAGSGGLKPAMAGTGTVSGQPLEISKLAIQGLEARLAQHEYVMKYGNRIFRGLSPLSQSDLKFLQEEMADLCSIVDETGKSMLTLFSHLLNKMWLTPPEADPRYWLADFLQAHFYKRLTNILERFDKEVEAGEDSREALASFHLWYYERARRWIVRMATYSGVLLENLPEFEHWRIREEQYVRVIKIKLELPQFRAVREYIHSIKPDDDWPETL